MILADFLDPNGNGVDVLDMVALLTVIGSLWVGAKVAARVGRKAARWVDRHIRMWLSMMLTPHLDARDALLEKRFAELEQSITDLTYPIQKHANGGKSLPDVAVMTRAIFDHFGLTLPEPTND